MLRNAVILAGVGLLLACSSPEEIGEGIAEAQGESAQEELERRVAADAEAVQFVDNDEVDNGGREFSYGWPAQVSAIPALASELEERRTAALAEQKTYWAEVLESCPVDGVACRNASVEIEWQVVADLENWLSLSSSFYTYTGGAHGNYGRTSLLWDRNAGMSLEPIELFTSLAALDAAIGGTACRLLNDERAERRGEPVNVEAGGWFNECVSMDDTVLFIGSSDGETFDRLGVYYGPYVAGPYAEGEFEFTLPVTQAVVDALKPQYRDVFSLGR